MSAVSSPIARVIAELETERENLTVRLTKVDAAIATMCELFHLPNGKPAAKVRKMKVLNVEHHPSGIRKTRVPAETNGKGAAAQDAIRDALHRGPLSPGELAEKVGMDRSAVRYYTKQLEAEGVLVATGATAARRIALVGKPAKEVPQR